MIISHESVLHNRAMSSFPLSIGTGLAFESLFNPRISPYDPERVIPDRVDLSKYKFILINLYTLFRNLNGSVDKTQFLLSDPSEIADVLFQETEVIKDLFNNEGNGLCKPVFYLCEYTHYYKSSKYSNIKFRTDNTANQKTTAAKAQLSLSKLLTYDKEFIKTDYVLRQAGKPTSLILTHAPLDLLNYNNFSKLSLLESHTGKLKDRHLWNSKYMPMPDENMNILPFIKKLLLVFGDKVHIQPTDIRLRRLIMSTAKNRNWTSMTTLDKVNLDLSLDIKEPYVLKFLQEIE